MKKAFTLAEVLITLAIVGVIATVIIPSLFSSTNDLEYKTAYKKAFAAASIAWGKASQEGTMVSRDSWVEGTSKVLNFKTFKAQFNIVKYCNNNNNADCWVDGENTIPPIQILLR